MLSNEELQAVMDGCVDGVFPTTQEIAMAKELIEHRKEIIQTELTNDESIKWAWMQLKSECETSNWTAAINEAYYSFFLHGWNSRTQYEKQTKKINLIRSDVSQLKGIDGSAGILANTNIKIEFTKSKGGK